MAETIITSPQDLVTSREDTRAGFIAMALEKNYMAKPYIEEAKILQLLASQVDNARRLIDIPELKKGLLTASGLSEKAINYLAEEDKVIAIDGMIDEFLIPAGESFREELVYRYLLVKGDALGGKARNLAGVFGTKKFLRSIIAVLELTGIPYKWQDSKTNVWIPKGEDTLDIETRAKALHWINNTSNRLLLINIPVRAVTKKVDIILLDASEKEAVSLGSKLSQETQRFIALGELKGGIDPAGADEHWKTAKSALMRIRSSFSTLSLFPKIFFIGAAIEKSMASEIFAELQAGHLAKAANLNVDKHMAAISDWIVKL